MTKVKICSGICGFETVVSSVYDEDEETVTLEGTSTCPTVQKMLEALPKEWGTFEVCVLKPGKGPFYEWASEKFPVHAGCPVCAGLYKCVEAECNLALKKNASIEFLE